MSAAMDLNAADGLEPRVPPASPTAPAPASTASAIAVRPAATISQAVARLTASRQRLQASLKPPPEQESPGHLYKARDWLRRTSWGSVLDPVLGAVGDDLARWWGRQAWRQSALLAKDVVGAELGPLVRRFPIAAMVVTAAAGAAFAGSGVWRWRTVRRSAAHLGAQLKGLGMSQLSNPAVQGLVLSGLMTLLVPKHRARKQGADEGAEASVAAAAAARQAATAPHGPSGQG